ncbi:MAG: helix-turn-helix transcriptional regulator [Lachnospiraceae bacterium]
MGKYLSKLIVPELEKITTNANFTDDELKVFEMLIKRKSITEIASKLCVSERTINRRIEDIREKMAKVGALDDCDND